LGKVKIAQVLARAGLHLAPTTVRRMVEVPRRPRPGVAPRTIGRVLTARYLNHLWHVDSTTVPTALGFWIPWVPFAKPQGWPFCWWVALVVDHFSRRVMGFAIYRDVWEPCRRVALGQRPAGSREGYDWLPK